MLRATLIALLAASPALAQNSSDYFPGFAVALNSSGLTSLASLALKVQNTTIGQQVFASLPNGNKTVFAPNNNAFTGSPPKNITDPNQLAAILSYHVISGSFANFSAAPNSTIMRTFLNSSQYVTLEGNKSQVLAVATDNGQIKVLGQNTPVHVVSSTAYQNLIIHVVDAVIDPPPRLTDVINSSNLTMLATVANQSDILSSLESQHGITIFAPNDAALQALSGQKAISGPVLHTVLGNHIINGTTVYSTQLDEGNYTSASGESFKFSTNSSGTFVTSGLSTAKIVQSDIFTSNGVVHIIDNVLLNTANNTAAASSALASATSVAAQTATETAGIGASSGAGGSAAPSGTAKTNSAKTFDLPIKHILVAFGAAVGGAVFVL